MFLSTRSTSRLAVLLAVPAMLLAFTACSAPAPAATGGTGSTGSHSSTAQGSGARGEWELKWASCMRENGVDMPDPSGTGQGMAMKMGDQETFQAAVKTCQEKVGTAPPLTAEEKKQLDADARAEALKSAKCYRDNGVDVADPAAGDPPKVPENAPKDVIDKCGFGPNAATRVTQ